MSSSQFSFEPTARSKQRSPGCLVAMLMATSVSLLGCGGGQGGGGGQTGDFIVGDDWTQRKCEDTVKWTDKEGKSCFHYERDFCWNGRFAGLNEAASYNHPEKHCCECGKGLSSPTPPAPTPRPSSPQPRPPTPRPPSPQPRTPSPQPRPPSPSPAPSGPEASKLEWEHFKLVNQLRADGFTCPDGTTYAPNSKAMKFDCRLWKASQLHSQDMADNNYFSHTSKDGRSPWDRARAQGASANGENIAAGSSTAQAVLEQWKKSNGHCKGMMNTGNVIFAVGKGANPGSKYKHYWTQMFGRSADGLDTSCHRVGSLSQVDGAGASPSFLDPVPILTVGDAWTTEPANETVAPLP